MVVVKVVTMKASVEKVLVVEVVVVKRLMSDVGSGGGCYEAVDESDVGGGGGCCEAVDESDVGGGGGGCEAVGPK